MPYNGPVWQSMAGADKRGEIYLQAGQNFGQAVGAGIAKLGDNIKELVSNREESDARKGTYEVFRKQYPELTQSFDDKFYNGSAGTQRGIISQMIAWAAQKDMANPATITTEQGGRAFVNRRTGAITPARDLEPPPMPTEVPNPTGGPPMGMNANGTVFEYTPPPATSEWKQADDGTVRHYKNGQPTGAMYRPPQQPGMVKLEGTAEDYIKVGPDGKPLEDGRTFRRRAGPWLPDQAPFDPVPDPDRQAAGGAYRTPYRTGVTQVYVQEADGKMRSVNTPVRYWPDGRTEILQPPNEANAAAGQYSEWKSIGGEQRPYNPATDLLPPPDGVEPAPGSPQPPATPAAPVTGTPAPRRWR